MATHLAARLVWHDRGWDGRICNAPKDNGWCIRYEWVREARDDQAEAQRCGKPVTQDVLPPCQHDTNAFASKGKYAIQHRGVAAAGVYVAITAVVRAAGLPGGKPAFHRLL